MNTDDMEGLDEETRKEIEELQKVTREKDGNEAYAEAMWNLSKVYYNHNFLEESIETNGMIINSDSKEYYSKAQYNIGIALSELRKYDGAIKAWLKVIQEDSPIAYARAQYNLGVLFDSTNSINDAMKSWKNVVREGDREAYAKAQNSIANMLLKSHKTDEAIHFFKKIIREDDPEVYASAQFNLGVRSNRKGNTNDALDIWGKIESKDSLEIYNSTQYNICTVSMENTQYQDISKAKQALERISTGYGYEKICLTKICRLIEHFSTKNIGNYLLLLFIHVTKIIEILKVDFNHKVTKDKPVERKLAHYTGTDITNLLLANHKKNNPPSSFRLNTINNVNDPSEGKLLLNYLKGVKEELSYEFQFDEGLQAFISCFTFNHDSLNQFRLYGKQDNKEASGISLVFNKDFFQKNSSIGGLSYVSVEDSSEIINKNSIQKSDDQFSKNNIEAINKIKKQPVMRCVYLDPTSNYIQLAQRNRLTFFREFNDETVQAGSEQISKAEYEWKSYQCFINKKTEDFSNAFTDLKSGYRAILEELVKIEKINPSLSDKIEILLNEILLPLKYLIKHSAFQEEQECRMVYMTSLDRSEVIMDYGKFLYVEYEEDVKANLDKIYIAPAATRYQPYLAKLLCNTGVKIELSNNPYRQT